MVLCNCNDVGTFFRHVLNYHPNQNNTHVFICAQYEEIDFILTARLVLNNENLQKINVQFNETFVVFFIL